jgi:hypothetical protein
MLSLVTIPQGEDMHIERSVETEGFTGSDHQFCDTHQRTETAISDGVVRFELVFDSREEYDQYMDAMDCWREATQKHQQSEPPFMVTHRLFSDG